jgi:HK97 family phage prohead protease
MPYFIEQVVGGWNTVKDDGTLLGKHKTKKQAIDQMVAVSLAEGIVAGGELKRAVEAGSYSPPAGVAVAAKRALNWIAEGYAGSGFTDVGRARAVQLASGRDVSADTVNRMISFFARQEKSVKGATGFNNGEEGFPSAGRVAWDAWGGDSGQSWVNGLNNGSPTRAVDKINDGMSNKESETRMSDEMPMTKNDLVNHVGELKGEVLELVGKLAKTVEDLSELVEAMTEPMDVVDVVDEVTPVADLGMMVEGDAVRFVEPTQVAELAKRGERVSKGIERRQALQDLEIRAEGDGMTLRGYAAVFNSPSQPLPFTETIQPGAFSDSLRSRNDVKLLWNHDTGIVLGSTRAGTLKLTEDERGLLVEASLPDTQAGRDAATLVKRGDVSAFSFGFRVPAGGDNWPSANERVLTRINIHEASLVAFPAYSQTEGTASVRGMTDLTSKIVALAELRGISADELTDALLALEAGEELTERQGELLTDTLNKVLQKDPEVTNPAALLDLKKKQLDLLMKRV